MNLTPGVNGDYAWGGTYQNNAYLMDGVNVGDPGASSQWVFPNMDWFEEIQVGGIGAPAEMGNFTGGYVNTIIKRGGNTLEGGVNGYYDTTAWQDHYNYNHPLLTEEDKKPGKAKNYDYGFYLGGPLVKDKLWYFVSASKVGEEQPIYGLNDVASQESIKLLGKITWQANENGTLEAFYEYDTWDQENRGLRPSIQAIATHKQKSPSMSYNVSYTHRLGSDKVLTAKLTGYKGVFDRNSYNGASPSLELWSGNYQGLTLFNNVTAEHSDDRDRICLSGMFDWFLTSGEGRHALRTGIDIEKAGVENISKIPGWVRYVAEVVEGDPLPQSRLAITGGGRNAFLDFERTCVFVQDTWTVNERLSLTPGLRWEKYVGKSGGKTYWSTDTLAPRMGVTWALTEGQSHVLKAHWGRYFESLSAGMFEQAVDGAYPDEVAYLWAEGGVNPYAVDPFNVSEWSQFAYSNQIAYTVESHYRMDPNIDHPYADALTFSYETTFAKIWKASLTYIHKTHHDAVVLNETALDGGTYFSVPNPLDGSDIQVWDTGLGANEHRYLVTNDSRAKRKYDAITCTLERANADRWNMSLSYTRAWLKGNIYTINAMDNVFVSPNSLLNSYGDLSDQSDHEIKCRGAYQFPTKTQVAATLSYFSGTHWTPIIPIFGLGPDYSDIAYLKAKKLGSETFPSRTLMDLRATQSFAFGERFKLEAYIEIRNIFNDGSPKFWETWASYGDGQIDSWYKYPYWYETPRNFRVGMRLKF